MKIKYKKRICKVITSSSKCVCKFGVKCGNSILEITKKLEAVKNFKDMLGAFPSFHELKYQAKGVFAIDVYGGYRMVMRFLSCDSVEILEIEDYHYSTKKIDKYSK